ncbi:MAG TPA: hypothetical protein VGD59_12365 [Acidisarcina sp.]
MSSTYPDQSSLRDQWITALRPPRLTLDPQVPYAFFAEEERSAEGEVVSVATIFLTNRECPWRCVMCDLWRNTLTDRVPGGAIPAQIDYALSRLPPAGHIKLYNSGSFFDPQAVPPEDYRAIADRLSRFELVTVECHPALVGERCIDFRSCLAGRLEVALGLETAHPQVLERLNKRMTLDSFSRAARFLHANDIDLRTFILVQPPFMAATKALYWAERSLDLAFRCYANVATLIPTRANNGAMEALIASGDFRPPTLELLEAALTYGISLDRGRVFADLWDVERLLPCTHCMSAQVGRLRDLNLTQRIPAPIACTACGKAA